MWHRLSAAAMAPMNNSDAIGNDRRVVAARAVNDVAAHPPTRRARPPARPRSSGPRSRVAEHPRLGQPSWPQAYTARFRRATNACKTPDRLRKLQTYERNNDSAIPIIDSILHPTDFTEGSRVAFYHALKAALLAKSKLTLLHVSPGTDWEWTDFPGVRKPSSAGDYCPWAVPAPPCRSSASMSAKSSRSRATR